jgi:hypothetical protein
LNQFGTSGDLAEVINRSKFHGDWWRSLDLTGGWKSACSHRKGKSSLTPHCTTVHACEKVFKRIYILYQLIRAGVSANDIIAVYYLVIRSILEYARPVWYPGLTKAQPNDLERVKKRCLKIIWPNLSYADVLSVSGDEKLSTRRENLVHAVLN